MTKYRTKKVTYKGETWFYPQYRILWTFWLNFAGNHDYVKEETLPLKFKTLNESEAFLANKYNGELPLKSAPQEEIISFP